MKALTRILTGIAAITLLFLGALVEITTPAVIIAVICIAWLILVGICTYRRRIWKKSL